MASSVLRLALLSLTLLAMFGAEVPMRAIPLSSITMLSALALIVGCKGASTCSSVASRAPAGAVAQTPPSDPAGRKLEEWLSAFNAADRARLACAHAEPFASMQMKIAEQSGGFDVHRIVEATPLERVALVRGKKTGNWRCLKLDVNSDPPHRIEMLMFGRAEAPSDAKAPEPLPPLDDQARRNVLDRLVRELNGSYVFPDKAAAIESELRARQARGAYDKLEGRVALIRALNQDLQRLSNDRHLRLDVPCSSSLPSSPSADAASPAADASGARAQIPDGAVPAAGVIGETRRLDGNVAYVEIRAFGHAVPAAADEIRQAMTRAADAAAIIFDVRQNEGGHEDNVKLVASYLFGNEPVHLSSLYRRPANRTEEAFTNPGVPGPKFGPEKPVYILTSKSTFSAPESFAYDLQALKRAVIVGEVTGGGAHPGDVVLLPHGLTVFIPNGRPINPITKTDWEGVGVKPDVEVPGDKALETAQKLARERVATARTR